MGKLSASRPVRLADPTLQYDDHALVTRQGAFAVTRIPTVPYAFTTPAERKDLGWLSTLSLAALKQGRVKFSTVQAPHDVFAAARALDEHVRATSRPAAGWPAHLKLAGETEAAKQPTEKVTYLTAALGPRSLREQAAWRTQPGQEPVRWWQRRPQPMVALSGAESARWAERAADVRGRLGRGGFGAVSVGAAELRALRRHAWSRTSTVTPSSTNRRLWTPADVVDEFSDVEVIPGLRWCEVRSAGGTKFTATFVTSSFPTSMPFPTVEPWLSWLDTLRVEGFPHFAVETDLIVDLIPPRVAKANVKRKQDQALDQRQDAARAGVELPIETEEILAMARELQYKIPHRRLPLAYGWARIRVDADRPEDLRAMFEAVQDHMGAIGGNGIDVVWPGGQAQIDLLAEAIPGLPVRHTSYRQRWTVETVACALPHAGSGFGHPGGLYKGTTTGREPKAVRLDLHHPITRRVGDVAHVERPGGIVSLGAPRAGKTGALGTCIYDETLMGHEVLAIDPSWGLKRLAGLPEMAGRIESIDVVERGDGVVDPIGPLLLPLPELPQLTGVMPEQAVLLRERWERECRAVRTERERLERETLAIVGWEALQGNADANTELLNAISVVSGIEQPSTMAVLDVLRRTKRKAAVNLAASLEFDLRGEAAGALTGSGAQGIDRASGRARTRILTIQGLQLPDAELAVADWSPDMRVGAATFGAVAHLAQRLMFHGSRTDLKLLAIDEAHVPLAMAQGHRVIEAALRMGPKHGLMTWLATHNGIDLQKAAIRNAVSMWFLFRSTDPDELEASFRYAGFPDTARNRETRAGLANGECMARLDTGVKDRFQWDQFVVGAARALNTTAGMDLTKVEVAA